MKVEVKKIDALRRELRFEVPKERVAKTLERVYSEIGKVAKIKGFRPGKAPRHVLEASHGKIARDEMIQKLIPEAYYEGIKNENLLPADMPEIKDVNFKDGALTFTATLDVRPEIKINNYKGIKVTRKASQVTDEEIEKTLEFFKKGQGDKEVVLDDTFARSMGYPNFQEFRQLLVRQLELDKDRQNRIDVENQLVEALLKEASFTVPQSMVKKQLEHRIHDAKARMKQQGMKAEDISTKEDDLRKNLQDPVERDVKVYLILQSIAEKENIQVNEGESLPHKVIEFLLKEANWVQE